MQNANVNKQTHILHMPPGKYSRSHPASNVDGLINT